MGRAIRDLAGERSIDVVGMLGEHDNARGEGIAKWAGRADVAIEFTQPHAAVGNLNACVDAGIPVVCGTTGWYEQRGAVEARVRESGGALLVAPNFSLGVALFLDLAERAGIVFASHPQYEGAIVETHHSAKLDAPSGTAAALRDVTKKGLGREVPVSSVRVGSVPGTHALLFDGPFEQIVLSHEARDRRVFADGALRAAVWLANRRGVFTMRDLLQEGRER